MEKKLVPSNFFNHEEAEKSMEESPPIDITERLNSPASQADLGELRKEFAKVQESVSEVWHSAALQDVRMMRSLGDIKAGFEDRLLQAAQRNVTVASEVAYELDGAALLREAELQKRIAALEHTLAGAALLREAELQKRIAALEHTLAGLHRQQKAAFVCVLLLIGLLLSILAIGH